MKKSIAQVLSILQENKTAICLNSCSDSLFDNVRLETISITDDAVSSNLVFISRADLKELESHPTLTKKYIMICDGQPSFILLDKNNYAFDIHEIAVEFKSASRAFVEKQLPLEIGVDCVDMDSAKYYPRCLVKAGKVVKIVQSPAHYYASGFHKETCFVIETMLTQNELETFLNNQKRWFHKVNYIGTFAYTGTIHVEQHLNLSW